MINELLKYYALRYVDFSAARLRVSLLLTNAIALVFKLLVIMFNFNRVEPVTILTIVIVVYTSIMVAASVLVDVVYSDIKISHMLDAGEGKMSQSKKNVIWLISGVIFVFIIIAPSHSPFVK